MGINNVARGKEKIVSGAKKYYICNPKHQQKNVGTETIYCVGA